MDGNNKAAYGLDKILCLHSLAHSATKIIYNFFGTYGLRYVITLLQCPIYRVFQKLLFVFLIFCYHLWWIKMFKKVAPPPKTLWNIFTSVKFLCVLVGNSYPRISNNFCRFILIFHQMELIFPRLLIVFTPSSFECSPIKWKCRGRFLTAWFTQNGWASACGRLDCRLS